MENITPLRKQYLDIKKNYPEAIVFFRLGDFYETFEEDARIAARELEIVLTSREMGKGLKVPLAGIPYHALDNYLSRLINRGYKVAICEQVTKPGETKGLVQRQVTRLVTPGTVVEPNLLESKQNNFLLSLYLTEDSCGLAFADISTSEFGCTQLDINGLEAEINRLNPAEIILPKSQSLNLPLHLKTTISKLDGYYFEADVARERLLKHFECQNLSAYGCENLPLAVSAAGALLNYLEETQKSSLKQLERLSAYTISDYMQIDSHTLSNLEIFRSSGGNSLKGSLLGVLDQTKTAMGGRLLRKFLGQPLLRQEDIEKRLSAVDYFFEESLARASLAKALGQIADMERIANRIRQKTILPKELISLKNSLETVSAIHRQFGLMPPPRLAYFLNGLKPLPEMLAIINKAITDDPPSTLGEGKVIRAGFNPEMDKLCSLAGDARTFLSQMEAREREQTGIKSLKLGYNRVFGYYIEVSNANLADIPQNYIRKQTLVNAERFITPELKEYENLILNAKERLLEMETGLYEQVLNQLGGFYSALLSNAAALASLDVLSAFAEVAVRNGYVRPVFHSENSLVIHRGRHPMVEQGLGYGSFVANDISLSAEDCQIIILTGPNMAGKSTYLKQTALIVLMAQIGSYVPAETAELCLTDRIFSRIGAREDLSAGQSTFMVEMVETASILNTATSRSLLILDEIGRGTSTYDGLAIAQAVVEYIHSQPSLNAKTLFATHYHELVELANYLPRVKNYNIAVSEDRGEVVFLHRIVPGGVDKSYGIHVAKLAGLPGWVIKRAYEVLTELENPAKKEPKTRTCQPQLLLPLTEQTSALAEEIKGLEIESLTPLAALNKLYELKKKAEEQGL